MLRKGSADPRPPSFSDLARAQFLVRLLYLEYYANLSDRPVEAQRGIPVLAGE